MASEKINFRAVPPLEDALRSRATLGQPLGGVAADCLRRHFGLMAAELRTLRLTETDVAYLLELLGTAILEPVSYPNLPNILAEEIMDDWDDDGQPTHPEMAEAVRGWSPSQVAAVIDAVARWRVLGGDPGERGKPFALRVRNLGFRLVPAE